MSIHVFNSPFKPTSSVMLVRLKIAGENKIKAIKVQSSVKKYSCLWFENQWLAINCCGKPFKESKCFRSLNKKQICETNYEMGNIQYISANNENRMKHSEWKLIRHL